MFKTIVQIWIWHLLYKKAFLNLKKSVFNDLPISLTRQEQKNENKMEKENIEK